MKGYVVFVKDDACDVLAYFASNEREAKEEFAEDFIKMAVVSSVEDAIRVLYENDFDGEYVEGFIEHDIPARFLLSWSK